MKYEFNKHTYELSSTHLWVDGKSCRSKVALYLTAISLLHQVNYIFDASRPCPLILRNYKDYNVQALFTFVSNLIITLCGCGQSGFEWLQVCRLTPAGRFETILDSVPVYAYEVFDRYHRLVETGASFHIDFLERFVHHGQYIVVR